MIPIRRRIVWGLFFLLVVFMLPLTSCAAPSSAPSQPVIPTQSEGEPVATEAVETEAPVGSEMPFTEIPVAEIPSSPIQISPTAPPPAGTVLSPPIATQTNLITPTNGLPAPSLPETNPPPISQYTPIATALAPEVVTTPAESPEPEKPIQTHGDHIVQVEWPAELRLGESDTVLLTLSPSEQGFILVAEYPEHQTITQTVSVVRPPDYEVHAVARLDGPGFVISPTGEQRQFLSEKSPVSWRWSLTPNQAGRQRLAISLGLNWIPIATSTNSPRGVTVFSKSLEVRVYSLLGMTHTQAIRTGILGLFFGAGLSIFAILLRPPHKRPILRTAIGNTNLSIELPTDIRIDAPVRALLSGLFNRYSRLVIEHEFLSGYSGAQSLLILPIRSDGRADAYTIAKIGERRSIQREFENYEVYVKDTLPPVTARIQHPPVVVRSSTAASLAALQYTFIGRPGLPPLSLRQELLRKPDHQWLLRLMETFGPTWWLQRHPYVFRAALEYDRLLPTHLVVEPAEGHGTVLDGRLPPSLLAHNIGDLVQLRHFSSIEPRADRQSFSLQGTPPPGHPALRVRWQSLTHPGSSTVRIIDTRNDILRRFANGRQLFGLPDPLTSLPSLLETTISGSQSTIHGDLNLENILVGPGGMLWLIDFANTRRGHTLLDFSHLTSEIVSHTLAPQIPSANEYLNLLASPTTSPYARFGSLLQTMEELASMCLFNPGDSTEFHRSLILACLGALKHSNITSHARQLLWLTAAWYLQPLVNDH